MKQLFPFLIILSLIITFSCDQNEASQESKERVTIMGNDTLKLDTPNNLKATIRLTAQAQDGVKNWSFYNNLTTTIDSLQVNTLGELRKQLVNIDVLYTKLEEAEEAVAPVTPEAVQTKDRNEG